MPPILTPASSLAELIAEHPDAREAVFGNDPGPWRHAPPPTHLDLIRRIQRELEDTNGTSR